MTEKWLWLPDWASDLSIWEDELTEINSSVSHSFLSYEEMLASIESPYKNSKILKSNVLVGWGMGALVLLLNASKRPNGQKWILLSPYADFCDEDSSWTTQNLMFMSKQMLTTIEPGVNSYAELYNEEFGEWKEEWLETAMKMNPQLLSDGIKFLATHKVTEVIKNSHNIDVLYGRMDNVIPPSQTLKLKQLLPNANFKERPKAGHWPAMLLS